MGTLSVSKAIVILAIACLCSPGQRYADGQIEKLYVRTGLTLRIVVRYPESELINRSLSTDLFIVGNGLGLAWNDPQLLTRPGTTDTWSIDLKFSGLPDGYGCAECIYNNVLPVNGRFEYRILTSNKTDMLGPNHGTHIHISKLEANFPVREEFSYPFFFTRSGSVHATTVKSLVNQIIGSRIWGYYLPPSYNENHYKTYKTFVVPDLSPAYMELYRFSFDDIFVEKAIAEEVVFIGSHDYSLSNLTQGGPTNNEGRTDFLTPIPGIQYYCYNGDWSDNCAGCIPQNVSGQEYMEYFRDGCGYPVEVGGLGEDYLDHVVNEVLPAVQLLTNDRIRFEIRNNLGIGGCSLGGLLACHALWTRPNTFGMGWCKSSSFWWPTEVNVDNGFYFLNHTIKKTNLGPRAPQRIYIDVGELEEDPYYAQVSAALAVVDTMIANSPQFSMDESLWFTLASGQVHSSTNCMSRTWNSLSLLSPPAGAARNPNPPA
uniref:Uncharacterized protein n=1 Tax=Daphnia magna TaxID=35525 RepID=A0A0P6DBY8_9CRUS